MRGETPPPGRAQPFFDWSPPLRAALALLLEAQTQILLFVGPEFLIFYNDASLPLLGDSHPAALGLPLATGVQGQWNELGRLIESVAATGNPATAQDRPFTVNCRGTSKTIYLDLAYSPLRSDCGSGEGRVEAVLCIVSETTGRIEALRSLRENDSQLRRMAAIIEGSDDAIMAVDLAMTVISWNRGAERLYGWRAEEMIGQSVLRLLPQGGETEELAILEQIRAGKRVEPYQTTRLCADGRAMPVSLTVSPIYDEDGVICGASKIARDISAQREAERMQAHLLFEMKHRVKNILATVLALARQSFGRLELAEYATFTNRVLALSHAQDLLTRQGQADVAAADLIAEVLAPFDPGRFRIEGPAVQIPGEAVLSITLALHELVTNALKYGALTTPEGRVEISWTLAPSDEGGQRLRLSWRERGGPEVVRPRRSGFGSVLIRDLLASTLQAKILLTYPPTGVEFSADFPLRYTASRGAESGDNGAEKSGAASYPTSGGPKDVMIDPKASAPLGGNTAMSPEDQPRATLRPRGLRKA